ncbi:MAG: phosphotransferase, partial [Pseudomonadota bacterium]
MRKTNDHWRTLLGEYWTLSTEWQSLAGEFDLNFSDGTVIYKVMRANCPRDIVDLQIACLTHLANRNLAVPRLVPTASGGHLIELSDGSSTHLCWAISRVPGTVLAETRPLALTLVADIATTLASLHTALADFEHPALTRTMRWDLREALNVRDDAGALSSHPLADTLHAIFSNLTTPALERLGQLPAQAIHNDLNEHNLFCTTPANAAPQLAGIIDFGDMIAAPRVVDVAIAAAYLMLQSEQPITALNRFVAAYAAQHPLDESEIALIWPLALTRMAVSAVHAHEAVVAGDDDPYLQTSQAAVTRFLAANAASNTDFIEAGLRQATGLPSQQQPTRDWIATHGNTAAPLFDRSLANAPQLDLHIAGIDTPDNPIAPDLSQVASLITALDPDGTRGVLGRYREARLIYGADFFLAGDHQASARRTFHIAIDVFLPAGTPVHAPLDGVVHSAEVCDREFDYGGLIVLKHTPTDDVTFYTLYGHLQHDSAASLAPGQPIKRGEVFAHLGAEHENGGWPPHIHF